MKQTAVEWLEEQLKEYDFSPRDNTYLIEIPSWIWAEKIEQAKAMEKEQIMNAHIDGQPLYSCQSEKAEKYYNETFKSE
jgi:hypothetical protein